MTATTVEDVQARPATFLQRARSRLNPTLIVGLGLLALVIAIAFVVPLLSPYESDEIEASAALSSPSSQHWLGADNLGRDILVRVADGYRISLSIAVGSVVLALLVGVPLGLVAGYAGGWLDNVIMRPLDVLMAFPAILLAITVMAIFGTGVAVLLPAIGIVYVPIIARVMRASTLATRRELFVEAARARGASRRRIVLRHVLPNSVGPVTVQASILMGIAILLEAALSFIGLGVRPPTPSLGLMLSDGRDFMANSAWIVAAPGIAIMVLVLAFNLIGDGLHDWLDPRGRARLR
ncbi:MAG TPA: ABC transporter permease [Gaiellaceae bacterium]|jgi:peptide/nickel transport system permease protein|nr:ABC transporter permease [Gaiellaceae bacterium]